jgi:2-polyprenyl-3-methyl-5-hydroxy-6-metoxy-1,4-benzoquinol methylase
MTISLTERQKTEERYHNEKYTNNKHDSYRHSRTSSCYRYYFSLIKDIDGLNVLDFGCGNGWLSVYLAARGAKVWGIDISLKLIEQANQFAYDKNLADTIHFSKMAGEDLTFCNNSFDLVLGSAILHHTDIEPALSGIRRVLKPGGKAIFIEPLNHNLLLRSWRKVTPWRRSPTEKAFLLRDLAYVRSVFPNSRFTYFVLTSGFSAGLRTIFTNSKTLIKIDDIFEKADSYLLSTFPFLQKYCAVAVMELNK